MSETGETETAQPGAQPISETGETVVLSVDEAAELLGITPQAVRKRIKAGTLPARRDGRAWRVFLERATDETGLRETARNRSQPETKPIAQPAHLQAQQLAALVETFTAPLVAQIADLSRENGRLQAERDAAAKAADALREENAFLRAIQAERDGKPTPATDEVAEPSNEDSSHPGATGEATERPETHQASIARSLWRRLFGGG